MKLGNKTILAITASVAVGMVGAAYAAVPLYNLFCSVTGFGGTPGTATAASGEILDRTVTVRFDGSVNGGLPIEFEPADISKDLHLGERKLAFYEVTNLSDRDLTLTATYNVTPFKAGPYFLKMQCFCFTEQTVPANETVELPVLFFIDPEMDEERNLDEVETITLSYTFYEKKGAKTQEVTQAPAASGPDS